MKIQKLFEPKTINSVKIRNRFVMPPMLTHYSNADFTVSERLIAYHATRARGGFGLNIVEAIAVHSMGKGFPRGLGFWDDSFISGFSSLTEAVHKENGKIFAQIFHAGSQTCKEIIGAQPVAPSAVFHPGQKVLPRELTKDEIYEIIESFANAARRAREAGFDGVEVHGAHGYLLSQFMSPHTNKRSDEYGGDLLGRVKLPIDIIKSIRTEVGRDFPVIIRMAGDERVSGGRSKEETLAMAGLLEEAGYDALHITTANISSTIYVIPCYYAPVALNTGFAEIIKNNVSIPVITTGRINDPLIAETILQEGKADFIGMGRASIADPELPNKVAAGKLQDIRPCIACLQGCIANLLVGKPITCLVNPAMGHEGEKELKKAAERKKVLVVGGGPAGLEAARVARLRGHKVTLCEKSDRTGGQLNIAAIPPYKHDISRYVKYMTNQVKKAGVEVRLNTEVDVETIDDADVVVVATGGKPIIPELPGVNNENVIDVWKILSGQQTTGRKVIIIGGGIVGCEAADFLASQGKRVTIVEIFNKVAYDIIKNIKFFLTQRLEEEKVEIKTSAKVTEILPDGVRIQTGDRIEELRGYDTIVLALGTTPVNQLSEELTGKLPGINIITIGDAKKPRKALDAVAEGWEIGRKI